MEQLVGILGIVVILGCIILFHEFGHFIVAKMSGMLVHEFSMGFGPALFKRQKGDTLYAIRLIPFGGYVRIAGMVLEEDDEEHKGTPQDRAFDNKPFVARFMTIVAGSLMNFVLAVIVFIILGSAIGFRQPGNTLIVGGVLPGGPAARAGVQADDQIVEVNGIANPTPDVTTDHIRHDTPPVRLVVLRDGQRKAFEITPTMNDWPERDGYFYHMKSIYSIGIAMGTTSGEWKREPIGVAAVNGVVETALRIEDTVAQFLSIATGKIHLKQISGPIGVGTLAYSASKDAVSTRDGASKFFGTLAFLSIAIGFFNLLPIPFLDGSHLLFMTISAIIRRPFDKNKLAIVHLVGLGLLLCLVLYATYNDIGRMIHK